MNQGLGKQTKQFEYAVGNAATVFANTNETNANIIFELPLIKTKGRNAIDLKLYFNHQNKDESGQFGKGVRLSIYKMLEYLGSTLNVYNADGSIDLHKMSENFYNKYTYWDFEITSDDIGNTYYLFYDKQRNELTYYDNNQIYPDLITNKSGEYWMLSATLTNMLSLNNQFGDKITFTEVTNGVDVTYTYNNVLQSKTRLTIENGKLTKIQYYDGENNLLSETKITYNTSNYIISDVYGGKLTKFEFLGNKIYKIYEGYESNTTQVFNSSYEYVFSFQGYKTLITNRFNDTSTIYFDKNNMPLYETNHLGHFRRYTIDKETYELKKVDSSFLKNENNIMNNNDINSFSLNGVALTTNPLLDEDEGVNSLITGNFNYLEGTGTATKTISLEGKAGDIISLSFMAVYFTNYDDLCKATVSITLDDETVTKTITNEYLEVAEMHTLNIQATKTFTSVTIKITLVGNCKLRIGSFYMDKKASAIDYNYQEKQLRTIKNGTKEDTIDYNDNNLLKTITTSSGATADVTYNSNKTISQVTNEVGTKEETSYHPTYNTLPISKTLISRSGSIKLENRVAYSSDGRYVEDEYDEENRVTSIVRDSIGRIQTITNSLSDVLGYTYENGFIKALSLTRGSSSTSNTFTYDSKKRVESVTVNGGSVYSFTYDDKNQIKSVKLDGTVIYLYDYDEVGNVIKQQNGANADYHEFVYNKNRIIEIKYNGTSKYTLAYNEDNELLETVTGPYFTRTYVYDSYDKLVEVNETNNSISANIKYEYNDEDKIKKVSRKVNGKSIVQSKFDLSKKGEVSVGDTSTVKKTKFLESIIEASNQTILNQFEIYPLHSDTKSLNGLDALTLTSRSSDLNFFDFNTYNKRYCLSTYKTHLTYNFLQSNKGTIMFRAMSRSGGNIQYLMQLKDSERKTIDLYLSYSNYIYLKVNNQEEINTGLSFGYNTWRTVGLSFEEAPNYDLDDGSTIVSLRVFMDGEIVAKTANMSSEFTSFTVSIGDKITSSSSYLNGSVEMLATRAAYCEETTLDNLMEELKCLTSKTSVDEFNRVAEKEVYKGETSILSNTYSYKGRDSNPAYTTNKVHVETIKSGTSTLATRTYAYNNHGQLISITDPVFGNKTYEYDYRGFLVNDNGAAITYVGNGNIKSYGTISFDYNDDTIKDKLTSVDGVTISYDSSNPLNPTLFDNTDYTFEGRRLIKLENPLFEYDYIYNEQGLRIRKDCDNGDLTKYFYDGDKLILEEYICAEEAEESYKINFLYDEQGLLFGLILNEENKYFYVRDIFQNILGLVDESGTLVVKYDYNAFGKILSVTDTSGVSIGEINPFRYKGYYYDKESQMYYCKSRYYVPAWGRWLNADNPSFLDFQGFSQTNLFSYCGNDPVNMVDPKGNYMNCVSFLSNIIRVKVISDYFKEGSKRAYYASLSLGLGEEETFGYTMSGLIFGDYFVVKDNWETISSSINIDNNNFKFQQNHYYSFWTAGLYAKHLKDNYYYNDKSRTELGIYIELQAHYVAYLLGNSHGTNSAYMGEATLKKDWSGFLCEAIAWLICHEPMQPFPSI